MTTVSFEIPEPILRLLKEQWGDVARASKESLAIESYRSGKISLGYLAMLLGLNGAAEAQDWLARRGVPLNYSLKELEADRATLLAMFGVAV